MYYSRSPDKFSLDLAEEYDKEVIWHILIKKL